MAVGRQLSAVGSFRPLSARLSSPQAFVLRPLLNPEPCLPAAAGTLNPSPMPARSPPLPSPTQNLPTHQPNARQAYALQAASRAHSRRQHISSDIQLAARATLEPARN